MFHSILDWLRENPDWLGAGIALIAWIESFFIIGVIVPGVALLFGAAALGSALGIPHYHLLAWAVAGAIAGDVMSFFIGRLLGFEAREHGFVSRHRKAWDRAHVFFVRYGVFAIVAGRFVGFFRPIIPAVAGAAGMRRRVFITTDVLSALAWAPAYILPGYYGSSWVLGL